MTSFLESSAFIGVAVSLVAYGLGCLLQKKWNCPLFNPLLISILITIVLLLITDMDYDIYYSGAKYLSYLLTPANTLRALLDAWRLRDAALLRSYTADAPDTETFAAALSDAPMLVSFGFSGGTISPDGQTVHLTLRLCCQDSAGITGEIGGLMVHMTRVGGLWKLPWTQLEALFSMLA